MPNKKNHIPETAKLAFFDELTKISLRFAPLFARLAPEQVPEDSVVGKAVRKANEKKEKLYGLMTDFG